MKRIKLISKLMFEERKRLIENMSAPIVLLFVVLLIITGSTINANTTSEKQQQPSVANNSPLSAILNINNNNNNNQKQQQQQAQLAPTPLALQASPPAGLASGPADISLAQAATQTSTIVSAQSSQAQQQQRASDVTSSSAPKGGQQQQQSGPTSDDNEADSLAASQSGGVESAGDMQTSGGQHYSQSQSSSSMINSIGQQQAGSILFGGASSSSSSVQAQAASPSASSVYPVRLPKINIYANKNEVMKLLGIDTRINYVTNGQLNTYPLGFTIPMGYHLSDMIFTWQNLGPTSVNYSISLVIGNLQAVELPLINITRSGLIPRQEQVFKITLPCSGKVTDEVDVQVLINIMGLVPVLSDEQQHLSLLGSSEGPASGDQLDQLDQVDQQQQQQQKQSASDYQLARAVQQQQNELMPANNYINNSGNQSAPGSDQQMQADESKDSSVSATNKRAQPQMRLVSHTLAIKRKKICTMHPVPVQPVASRQPEIRPPNQVPSTQVDSTTAPPPLVNKLSAPEQQAKDGSRTAPHRIGGQPSQQTWQPAPPASIASVEPPAHLPGWPLASATLPDAGGPSFQPEHSPASSSSIKQAPQATSSPQAAVPSATANQHSQHQHNHNHHQHHHQWQPTPAGRVSPASHASSASATSTSSSLNVPLVPASQQQLPPPADNPLIELLRQQQQQQAAAANSQPGMATGNPLLFTLIVMSLIISIALIALLIIGTTSSSQASMRRHKHPLDKLSALTNCILRRTGAVGGTSRAANKCGKSVPVGPITIKNGAGFGIGTFAASNGATVGTGHTMSAHTMGRTSHNTLANRTSLGAALDAAGPKLSVLSTISGQQQHHHQNKHDSHHAHSGHHHHHGQQHQSSNSNNSALFNYYKQQQQQQHGYSTTGTGGYYHHYQYPPDLLIGTTNNAFSSSSSSGGGGGGGRTSPYHITMSNNQTTKLYFANNLDRTGAYTIDNNYTTTPGAGPQPRSDCGSVYQTIAN